MPRTRTAVEKVRVRYQLFETGSGSLRRHDYNTNPDQKPTNHIYIFVRPIYNLRPFLLSLPPRRWSDPGSHSGFFSTLPHYGTCLGAFLSRERVQPFLLSTTRTVSLSHGVQKGTYVSSDPSHVWYGSFTQYIKTAGMGYTWSVWYGTFAQYIITANIGYMWSAWYGSFAQYIITANTGFTWPVWYGHFAQYIITAKHK